MSKIFTITTLNKLHEENNPTDPLGPRCVGWYKNHDDAIKAVESNRGDIWEGSYEYAVIECVHEGLYGTDTEYELFQFDKKQMKYVRIEVPKYMQHFCGFGIG